MLCNHCRDNREHANYNKAGRSGSKLFKEVIWEWVVNEMKMTLIQGKFKTWFMLMLKLMGVLESRNTINE